MSLDFQQVKKDFPIEKVVELLGIEISKQRNGQLRGCCPIHGGNDPRGFVITPARNLWFCFKGCGGGDQLALIAKIQKISPKQAAEWLVGGTVQEPVSRTVPDREQLPEQFQALDYLESDHQAVEAVGFEAEIAKQLGIGYAPRGTMKGTVAVPLRTATGDLVGYIGITEAVLPSRWHLPNPKVVPLRPKKAG